MPSLASCVCPVVAGGWWPPDQGLGPPSAVDDNTDTKYYNSDAFASSWTVKFASPQVGHIDGRLVMVVVVIAVVQHQLQRYNNSDAFGPVKFASPQAGHSARSTLMVVVLGGPCSGVNHTDELWHGWRLRPWTLILDMCADVADGGGLRLGHGG